MHIERQDDIIIVMSMPIGEAISGPEPVPDEIYARAGMAVLRVVGEIDRSVEAAEDTAVPLNPRASRFMEALLKSPLDDIGMPLSQECTENFVEDVIIPIYKARPTIATSVDHAPQIRLVMKGLSSKEIVAKTGAVSVKAVDTGRNIFIKRFHVSGYTPELLQTALRQYAGGEEGAVIVERLQAAVAAKAAEAAEEKRRKAAESRPDEDPGETVEASKTEQEADEGPVAVLTEGRSLSEDPIKDWLKEIGKYPLLNAAEEVDLAKRIEAGVFAQEKLDSSGTLDPQLRKELAWLSADGARAKERMLVSNLRLVVSLAKRYTGHGLSFIDLIQEGNVNLIRAVEKFDYKKGFKFSTYATWWIRQALTRALADQSRTVRVPVHMVEQINKQARIGREMIFALGREPTTEELAAELGVAPEKVLEVRGYGREAVSLNMPIDDAGESELGNIIEDAAAIDPGAAAVQSQLSEELRALLGTLDGREQWVIRARFGIDDGEPKTLDAIGKIYGISRERVRQIEDEALAKLRKPSRSAKLAGLYSEY